MKTRVVHCKKAHYDVYIGRPGYWGNPFALSGEHSRPAIIQKYREWLLSHPEMVAKARQELKGKVLGCWCAPKPCHGDVLVELVDAPEA
jgi:hypothetical protein